MPAHCIYIYIYTLDDENGDNWFIDLNITILLRCLKAHFCTRNKSYKVTTLGFMSWGIVVVGGGNASRCPTNTNQHELIKLKYYYRSFRFYLLAAEADSDMKCSHHHH